MIPTPSTHPRLSAVPPSGIISHTLSTLPATARPEILPCESRFTRLEFRDAAGLSCLAVDKFLELGFIKPFGVWENGRREIYYSMGDLKKVRVMMTLLDGKLNLIQAHEKALEILNGTTSYRDERVKKALELSPPERFIDRPYEMPSDWKKPENSDADTEQDTNHPQKPRRVNMTVTHSDGTQESKDLSGRYIPERRDWEDRADELWLESEWSQHGPVVSIRMEDESGQKYLRELVYPLPARAP